MRILFISTSIPFPPTDGGKLVVYGLLKSLAERGHEIELIAYLKHDDYKTSYENLKQYCIPHILDYKADNSLIGAFKNLFSSVPYNASKYYSKLILKYTIDLINRKSFDIIQINHLHLGWLADHIRLITKSPLVMRSQNIETIIMKRYSDNIRSPLLKYFSSLQYKKLKKYELQIYSKFDLCIMISDSDLHYLKKHLPETDAINIPGGVDSKLFIQEITEVNSHSIAHIGHTDWYPNYDSLKWFITGVLPLVLKKYPDSQLYVYGGGNTKNFPVDGKLKKNVNIIGFVDNLWNNLSKIKLAVVPLRIGGGIRIKILELLASGNLVISTSIGKEGINVQDYKHLLVADTAEEFADRIIQVFDGYDVSRIIMNGRKFMEENYSWEVISQRFEESYRQLIEV